MRRVQRLKRAAARAGVPDQSVVAASRQAQDGGFRRCAAEAQQRCPRTRSLHSAGEELTRLASRRAVAEREFNAMQKAYELLWYAAAQPLLCAAAT